MISAGQREKVLTLLHDGETDCGKIAATLGIPKMAVAGVKASLKRQEEREKKKWQEAKIKSHRTHVLSRTFTRWWLTKKGYKCVTFENRNGQESADGVVDLVAVKKDRKDKNKLRVILFQLKGGAARVTAKEKADLKKATKTVTVEWNYAEKPKRTVLFFKDDL